jgi:ppGpp synthetase/RelA/SpoT-type nucleotidyltranferase
MSYREPPTNKAAVRRAGKAISENRETQDDIALLDQWRMSHGYVLNTFKVWIRRKINDFPFEIEFAQRLKRRNTVIDKLRRVDAEGTPLIRDVTGMHDFAGCRLIFDNVEDLKKYREYTMSPRFVKTLIINSVMN